ncbi:metallophosphoesterase 1-like isoform X3 [Anguilla anguilla]|uniref:metallophosphoesterase 1-like isoform X3 n=1 Tax=Anguilla anguilla TaxID=7936 RepID=UPI0015B2F469|nr:metallophosphoesterase 1-like isoform X3 [Anguilla anguilla]
MPGLNGKWSSLIFVVWTVSCAFIFCEYLIYYPAIFQCAWPEMDRAPSGESRDREPVPILRALILSDTHLLGAIRGHWFDKLRREWQMERAFQTAMWLLRPEVVFILGDVFDEGKWSSTKNWDDDVRRFHKMFRHPRDTELIVLVGNHDVGFHSEMNWYKLQRFEKVFNVTSARIVTRKGVNFLLVNSVALHGDGCPICQTVESELLRLSQDLNCSLQQSMQAAPMAEDCSDARWLPFSRPVILQVGQQGCTEGSGGNWHTFESRITLCTESVTPPAQDKMPPHPSIATCCSKSSMTCSLRKPLGSFSGGFSPASY